VTTLGVKNTGKIYDLTQWLLDELCFAAAEAELFQLTLNA
jgi:hypothetical protein